MKYKKAMKNQHKKRGLSPFLLLIASICFARAPILVDDFSLGETKNRLNQDTMSFNCNPNDKEQFCLEEFDEENMMGAEGYSLHLTYDVDTPQTYIAEYPNTSFNGYVSPLGGKSLTKYKYLIIDAKGDKEKGFTRKIIIELKNNTQVAKAELKVIDNFWKRFYIPLRKFREITDWMYMTELVVVFNEHVTKREGAVYIDNILFTEKEHSSRMISRIVPEETSVKIDGDLSEWEGMEFTDVLPIIHAESGNIKPKGDFKAAFSFMWDMEDIYFAAKAEDNDFVYGKDFLGLYIDLKKNGFMPNGRDDFYIEMHPVSSTNTLRVETVYHQEVETDKINTTINVVEADPQDKDKKLDTYTVEAAIPWKFFGRKSKKRKTIRISPFFNDVDDKDESHGRLSWFYGTGEDHATLGVMKLKK